MIRKCVFLKFATKDIIFLVGIMGNVMTDSAAKSVLSRLVYPLLILNILSANIFFLHYKMFGIMQLRKASFFQANPGELALHLQVVQEIVLYQSHTFDPFISLKYQTRMTNSIYI